MAERRLRLRWDASACDGVGICLHLAGPLLPADRWGYPIVPDRVLLDKGEQRAARAAARGCPRRALIVQDETPDAPTR